MAFEYAIVLTGSIATGKSSVAKLLKEDGFAVIDADKIAHKILNQQHKAIADIFGNFLVKEQVVDRKALGAMIFSNPVKRRELEALLHPLIYNEIIAQAKKQERLKKPYFVDIPLFFEGGKRYPMERILVIYTTPLKQLERLMQRDDSAEEEAGKRIASQISIEQKRKSATYLIDNRRDKDALKDEYIKIKEQILGDFR
ncbi:MAG: dephospho-CoA kinase [Campylobacterota bacterium]|nr:dephospho-CoA kinase [Campylobacterota bacterium]